MQINSDCELLDKVGFAYEFIEGTEVSNKAMAYGCNMVKEYYLYSLDQDVYMFEYDSRFREFCEENDITY